MGLWNTLFGGKDWQNPPVVLPTITAAQIKAQIDFAKLQKMRQQQSQSYNQYATQYNQLSQQLHPSQMQALRAMQNSIGQRGGFQIPDLSIYHRAEAFKNLRSETKFGEIEGWRGWKVVTTSRSLRLTSVSSGMIWQRGTVTGEDGLGNSSEVFDVAEHVGYYALKQASYLEGWGGQIIGRVAMWGDVVEHENGYRAECMRILSIGAADGAVSEETMNQLRAFYLKGDSDEHRRASEEIHGRTPRQPGADDSPSPYPSTSSDDA